MLSPGSSFVKSSTIREWSCHKSFTIIYNFSFILKEEGDQENQWKGPSSCLSVAFPNFHLCLGNCLLLAASQIL